MTNSALKPLDQQVIVLTGASSGIGLCTALMAARAGARLVLIARSADVLEKLTADLDAEGLAAIPMVADVSVRVEMDKAAQTAVDRFGRIDTWINNAGLSIYGRLDAVSEEDSRRLFDINFWGVVKGPLAALPHLRTHGGALVNLGSEVSDAVVPLQGMYSASKHAVKGFTDALRIEIEQLDNAPVSITLIQPTAVDTPFPQHARNYMTQEPKLPSPLIDPQQVAEAILKAATEGGRDVTVGAMAAINTAAFKITPSLADKFAAKQARRQQIAAPPMDPQGTLYKPGHAGQVYGQVH
ncbi:short-chain dehydrogenase [Novimethylophilus kurashikiensis]|uniref:Short-chain dehydrogenase n=1 Tax=Novimethylophilus kurashikiensis TaxID=1825523 RepID=A0A2R5F148_9PROT|nr:SDR family oxidoreductase [Novimethylophilus kurashikiensis]GBG12486.1 short-chain dehydrogenase [Novimethylophilus kurashikiensis]